jgi:hypothetical protein
MIFTWRGKTLGLPIDSAETIDLGLFPFNGGWLVLVGNG